MSKVEETKEKIIRATLRVASLKGFVNTRTSDIAKEAGVSEGLIFKYFPTKSHLFAVIINDTFQRLKTGLELIMNDHQSTATTKLFAWINFHFNFFTNERNIAQLIFSHSDKKSIDFHVEPILEYGLKPYVQLIAKVLNDGVKSKEFRPLNGEIIATVMIGSMQLTLVNKILFESSYNLDEAKREIIDFFLTGIKI